MMEIENFHEYCHEYVDEHGEWPTVYAVRRYCPAFENPTRCFGVYTEYREAEMAFEAKRFAEETDIVQVAIELVEYSGNRLYREAVKRRALRGRKIMLAVKPEYAEKILDGSKRYEYRRKIPNCHVSQIVIYETAPVSKVVGTVDVDEMLGTAPRVLYDMTKEWAGISEDGYNDYFKGSKMAFAYSMNNPIRFKKPAPIERYGLKQAPQSFAYVKD